MQQFEIPVGARMFIGVPANPMSKDIVDGLTQLVSTVAGVVEAHLPQVFIEGVMEAPTQMLVLATKTGGDSKQIVQDVNSKLPRVLPPRTRLDILPFEESSSVLTTVRSYGCLIYKADPSTPGRTSVSLRV